MNTSESQAVRIFKLLQTLPDPRDNRGKRHGLDFVPCGVLLAILSSRSRLLSTWVIFAIALIGCQRLPGIQDAKRFPALNSPGSWKSLIENVSISLLVRKYPVISTIAPCTILMTHSKTNPLSPKVVYRFMVALNPL